MKGTYFISGIDTDIGKTIATGALARELRTQGVNAITQKMIQTGNEALSEDIVMHRKMMGLDLLPEDLNGLTAPYIFSYPCSPHMASQLDGKEIDLRVIEEATKQLEERFEVVLLEGAGGLMVPITEDYLSIDYICDHNYPLIFVTSGRLGSLNHTLLNLEIIKQRGIRLERVIYNLYPNADALITSNSQTFIKRYLAQHFPETNFVTLGKEELL